MTVNREFITGSGLLNTHTHMRGYESNDDNNEGYTENSLFTHLWVSIVFYFVTCPCSFRTKRHDNLFVGDDDDDDDDDWSITILHYLVESATTDTR